GDGKRLERGHACVGLLSGDGQPAHLGETAHLHHAGAEGEPQAGTQAQRDQRVAPDDAVYPGKESFHGVGSPSVAEAEWEWRRTPQRCTKDNRSAPRRAVPTGTGALIPPRRACAGTGCAGSARFPRATATPAGRTGNGGTTGGPTPAGRRTPPGPRAPPPAGSCWHAGRARSRRTRARTPGTG